MSVFDVGFIMWGYFALYLVLTAAYYGWLVLRNRRDGESR
jgi:hypothetical protein